jgi:hypothetical protein
MVLWKKKEGCHATTCGNTQDSNGIEQNEYDEWSYTADGTMSLDESSQLYVG